jgi:hypothetical protein
VKQLHQDIQICLRLLILCCLSLLNVQQFSPSTSYIWIIIIAENNSIIHFVWTSFLPKDLDMIFVVEKIQPFFFRISTFCILISFSLLYRVDSNLCWMICFILFVRLSFPKWIWLRVIQYTQFRLRVHGGCDRSAEDAYSTAALDPTFAFVVGPFLSFTRLCNCLMDYEYVLHVVNFLWTISM